MGRVGSREHLGEARTGLTTVLGFRDRLLEMVRVCGKAFVGNIILSISSRRKMEHELLEALLIPYLDG
jgi:hypothetical protein